MSLDGGAHWARFDGELPRVPVYDLEIHPRDDDLIVGTHGRGIWIVDDLSPLRALDAGGAGGRRRAAARRGRRADDLGDALQDFPGNDEFFAGNPPEAASIFYYLKKRHVIGDFKIEVFDAQGKRLTTIPAGGARRHQPRALADAAGRRRRCPAGNEIQCPPSSGPSSPRGPTPSR